MNMRQWMRLALLCSGLACVIAAVGQTTYPVLPERHAANARSVANDLQGASASWQAAPCVYYAVPALSPVKRLPDTYPADGTFLGAVQVIAAQGEFEPASLVVYAHTTVERLALQAGELRNGAQTLPASTLDIKIVKVWYQAGSAWYGYFADRTQRVAIPELLLNDENLIKVDHTTKDNYVRYASPNGPRYAWMSFLSSAVNHKYVGQAKTQLIADSPTLLPARLPAGQFTQFFVTVHVPADAAPGLYTGSVTLVADGKTVGTVPVALRVLPFQLPRPATYYDLNKEFYGGIYCQPLELDSPKVLQNLRNHNILNPLLPYTDPAKDPTAFERMIDQLRAAGLSTKPLFAAGVPANLMVDTPPTPEQQAKLDTLKATAQDMIAKAEKLVGHREVYSYGVDEGGPNKIIRERPAWRLVHAAGGKVMVSSYPHERLIYNLDFLIIPGMPAAQRKQAVDKWHAANPHALVAWYANPHSGPENPDYFRRIHGLMTYKANYDAICNYVWYRNNWNDFWVPAEAVMRGLTIVYPTRDSVIDTLAWEGLREGLDDIRYATKLKQLAMQAMAHQEVAVQDTGRKALAWLAYWDETREDLTAGRLEMINLILGLDASMKGGR